MLNKTILLLFSLMLSYSCYAQDDAPRFGLGLSGGWGAPYGFGIQMNYAVVKKFELNLGGGFSMSGLRGGFGGRFIFKPEVSSPFLGINYVRTTGLSELDVSVSDQEGVYSIPSNSAIFIRGGYRIKIDKIAFLLNAGYGIATFNRTAEHVSGDRDDSLQNFADLMRLGGLEMSLTIMFLL